MRKVRYLIDSVAGLAGLSIMVLLLFSSDYVVSKSTLNLFALIGLFRLNLLDNQNKIKSKYYRLHFIGLTLTIVSFLLIYLDVNFGKLLVLPGIGFVALYHIIDLIRNAEKDYLNVMHIVIYVLGFMYIAKLYIHFDFGMGEDVLIKLLNSCIFLTLIIKGVRGLIAKEKVDYEVDETPIDFPH